MGFVLKNKLIEVENICDKPEEGFLVAAADLKKYLDTAVGTWHTHPGKTSNLSANDYQTFINFPSWDHYIVGTDGVTCYRVSEGRLIVV